MKDHVRLVDLCGNRNQRGGLGNWKESETFLTVEGLPFLSYGTTAISVFTLLLTLNTSCPLTSSYSFVIDGFFSFFPFLNASFSFFFSFFFLLVNIKCSSAVLSETSEAP